MAVSDGIHFILKNIRCSTDWTIFQFELAEHCDLGSVGACLLYTTVRIPVSPLSTARSLKQSDHYSIIVKVSATDVL